MNTAINTTAPAPPRSGRHRKVVGVLAFLAFAVAGVFAVKMFVDWRLRADWAGAEAETDQLDPGWRLKEVLARLQPIPDDQNSALLIRELADRKPKPGASVDADISRSKLFNYYPPFARYSVEQIAIIEKALDKSREKLQSSHKLKDMPRGYLPVADPEDLNAVAGREHIAALQVVNWLKWDAILLAHQAKYQQAAESCQAIRNVARSMEEGQGYLVLAIQSNCYGWGVSETLERVLAQGQVPTETLLILQKDLENDAKENFFLRAVRGERIYSHVLFESVRDGKLPPDQIRGLDTGKWSFWWHSKFPATYLHDYPEYLRQMNQLVEIAKLPSHELSKPIATHAATAKIGSPFTNMVLTSRLAENIQGLSSLRSTMAAIASERYRMARGNWPQSLDVLVQEKYLAEAPLDPVDGKPLRFRVTNDGIVIYSIGLNGIDEQGNMRRHGFIGASDDMGFRLWDERFRGQPPVAPVELKKKKR
jgi:hypothetical protein